MMQRDCSPIKGLRGQVSLAFLFGSDTFDRLVDKEKKKIVADLCSSVSAMKTDIGMLKNEATNSGTNPAGSQNSEIVPGNPHPNKRRNTTSDHLWTFRGKTSGYV